MPDWLYEAGANRGWVFLLITVVIGGSAAWVSGKSIAQTWRPMWQIPVYMLLLTAGVRFLHFALFQEPLLPARNWAVDYAVLLVLAASGFRRMRALQISTQYSWLFKASGPFGWRRRPAATVGPR
jgi:hypothetical protein